jgi:hypothetical protein
MRYYNYNTSTRRIQIGYEFDWRVLMFSTADCTIFNCAVRANPCQGWEDLELCVISRQYSPSFLINTVHLYHRMRWEIANHPVLSYLENKDLLPPGRYLISYNQKTGEAHLSTQFLLHRRPLVVLLFFMQETGKNQSYTIYYQYA